MIDLLPLPDPPDACRLLAIGADSALIAHLAARGHRVDAHALDLGPAATLGGKPITPPVTAWPMPDGAYGAVLLLDELALVVDDEAAVAEAARVLRPGGTLILRVPSAGPLAWLDAYNLYRYLRDTTRRGLTLPETRGIGWRRHYRRRDLAEVLGDRFRIRSLAGQGVGMADALRLALLVLCRWLLRSERCYRRVEGLLGAVERVEAGRSLGPFGYHLVVVAERVGDARSSA